ncbi:aminotransferase class I/II-fold pyridoxal phosphate-dependent enzyme [Isosphaeraceae bacterium EP7]
MIRDHASVNKPTGRNEPEDSTRCARPAEAPPMATEPLVPPLHLSAVYKIKGLDQVDALYGGEQSGYIYARDGHPNASQLAAKVASLEGAEAALVCASGMGAEAAPLLALLGSGDHIALSEGVYGRTSVLVNELSRYGVTHSTFDPTSPESLQDALTGKTRVVFAETLSNPLLRLADLPGLAEVAREAGATFLVDHTFAPLLCRPIALGADAVTHSATKLIGGHADLTQGVLAGSRELVTRAGSLASTFGMTGNPFESWLALRGLSTLALRVERTSTTALELAGRLERVNQVYAVHYPGLAVHPDHVRARSLLGTKFGAMLTFDLGSRAAADRFIRTLEHIPFAPSLGDVSTTLSHPVTTSHRSFTPERAAALGITPGLIRLSVGLEDPADLWADLSQALEDLK